MVYSRRSFFIFEFKTVVSYFFYSRRSFFIFLFKTVVFKFFYSRRSFFYLNSRWPFLLTATVLLWRRRSLRTRLLAENHIWCICCVNVATPLVPLKRCELRTSFKLSLRPTRATPRTKMTEMTEMMTMKPQMRDRIVDIKHLVNPAHLSYSETLL